MTRDFTKPSLESLASKFLNLNQSLIELEDVYAKDYYWYLRSPEFGETFLKPIGDIISKMGSVSVLDVGCGEGQLYEYIPPRINYTGIDACPKAIAIAMKRYPFGDFVLGRMEDPTSCVPCHQASQDKKYSDIHNYDVIVFGGILEVLIKPEERVNFLRMYDIHYNPSHLIVYDLDRLDTTEIERTYPLVYLHKASTPEMPNLPDVKRHRKVMVFKCRKN